MIRKVVNCGDLDNVAYIVADNNDMPLELGAKEKEYVSKTLENKGFAMLNFYDRLCFFISVDMSKSEDEQREKVRVRGCSISDTLNAQKYASLCIVDKSGANMSFALAEGVELANYRFDKYMSKKKDVTLTDVKICGDVCEKEITRLNCLINGVFLARNIVNEPLSYMTAKKLSEEI